MKLTIFGSFDNSYVAPEAAKLVLSATEYFMTNILEDTITMMEPRKRRKGSKEVPLRPADLLRIAVIKPSLFGAFSEISKSKILLACNHPV
eukprot:m.109505 g.109505  ORF g.109505 m.109505 type:complete len:91 (-) comp14003_c3_seq2:710-982(-)